MSDELTEFMSRVGTEVAVYRECQECGDLYIVNPETYEKPKLECDPGYCPHWVPACACRNYQMLWTYDRLESCDYPDCTKCNEE